MQKVTTILTLRIDLHAPLDSQKNPANCDLTHILNRYSSECADSFPREVPPVTLLEPITKLVTGTVARRLSLLLHEHSLLHEHQFGFVHGGSCEAPIEIVNDMYEHACEHDVELHVAYLDATSAFDTVQHPALTAAFAAIGTSPSFFKWIKFMVTGHRRVIRTAYSMGDPASEFTLESGTPQGDPPPPLLSIMGQSG